MFKFQPSHCSAQPPFSVRGSNSNILISIRTFYSCGVSVLISEVCGFVEKSPLNSILLFSVSSQHMHEAVALKQQLHIEHEQALVALHTKQKEIKRLQKVWPKIGNPSVRIHQDF